MSYMKNMTFKEKVDYIKEYYKYHIIAGIILVAVVGIFIYSQITQVEYIMNMTFTESILSDSSKANLEKSATQAIITENDSNKRVQISLLPINSETAAVYAQKLMAEFAVGGIDIIVVSRDNFSYYQKVNAFMKLEDVNGLDLKKYERVTMKDPSGKTNQIYGLSMSGDNQLRRMNINTDNNVLCFAVNSKNVKNAVKLVNWIYGK